MLTVDYSLPTLMTQTGQVRVLAVMMPSFRGFNYDDFRHRILSKGYSGSDVLNLLLVGMGHLPFDERQTLLTWLQEAPYVVWL